MKELVEGVVFKSKGITESLLSRSLQPIWEDKLHTKTNYKTYLQSNINTNKYIYMSKQHIKAKGYCVNNCLEVPR